MLWLDQLPVWGLGLAIFLLRIIDVSLGTIRTIAVVEGRTKLSVILGFFEVLVWVTAVAKVFQYVATEPIVLLCYASGFAAGNAVGILLERRLAMGLVILRIVTAIPTSEMAAALRDTAMRVITFQGREGPSPVTLLYAVSRRKDVRTLLALAREHDDELFFAVDSVRESNALATQPFPGPTGWRAVTKKK